MPLVGSRLKRKRQSGTTCPSGYTFYACNNAEVVWNGCCAIDACISGCDDDDQPDEDEISSSTATSSTTATSSSVTSTSTSAIASGSVASSTSLSVPGTSETSLSSPATSSSLGNPPQASHDPSSQEVTGYDSTDGISAKEPPHTDHDDIPAIIGATCGAVAIVALVFLLFFCNRRRKARAQRRRRDTANPKRNPDGDGVGSDPNRVIVAGGSHRSRSRLDEQKKSRASSRNGSNYDVRSPSRVSAHATQAPPLSSEPARAGSCNSRAGSSYELQSNIASPTRSDSAVQSERIRHEYCTTNASKSDAGVPAIHDSNTKTQELPPKLRAASVAPSYSSSRHSSVTGQNQSLGEDPMKRDPYTGPERVSRATGSTFTPAHGATATPTITISSA